MILRTKNNGTTELIGALFFKNRQCLGMVPAMIVEDGWSSCSFNGTRLPYDILIQHIRKGWTRTLTLKDTGVNIVPLYVGY